MLKTRIIPVLLLKNGRMVKGVGFDQYRDVGDPVSAAKIYNAQSADELIFLDIEASVEGRRSLLKVVETVASVCFMPFTVGGGVRTLQDVRELLLAGADRVCINSAAFESPELIREASQIFGSQCIVVSVDVREQDGSWRVYSHSGKQLQPVSLEDHVRNMEILGAGELLINSIDRDGAMKGYDLRLMDHVKGLVNIPIIACGGVGNYMDLYSAAVDHGITGLACSSVFHFSDNNPIKIRRYLKNKNAPVRNI